jgi:hypothetical protein
MKCSEVQALLSPYFDGELHDDAQSASIAQHLEACATCSEELALFQQLSAMSSALAPIAAPQSNWDDLQAKLQATDAVRSSAASSTDRWRSPRGLIALAAMLLLAVGLGIYAMSSVPTRDPHAQLAVVFERYLTELDTDPARAQQVLLTAYNGRPVTLKQATSTLGYEPLLARSVPPGCTLVGIYLLEMPCCRCAQVVSLSEQGQVISVFEHSDAAAQWFGDRPAIDCLCEGQPTNVVQLQDRLAATWKQGGRYVTLVGARDLKEVTNYVRHLNRSTSG